MFERTKSIVTSPPPQGAKGSRRAIFLTILLGLVVFVTGCERTRESRAVVEGVDPNAMVRLEIHSNPSGQVWVANIGDENTLTTINGTTPFVQDFAAPDGLGVGVRKVSAGGVLAVCLTNLTTGERRCGETSSARRVSSRSLWPTAR